MNYLNTYIKTNMAFLPKNQPYHIDTSGLNLNFVMITIINKPDLRPIKHPLAKKIIKNHNNQ